jgi:hypothetical protein
LFITSFVGGDLAGVSWKLRVDAQCAATTGAAIRHHATIALHAYWKIFGASLIDQSSAEITTSLSPSRHCEEEKHNSQREEHL